MKNPLKEKIIKIMRNNLDDFECADKILGLLDQLLMKERDKVGQEMYKNGKLNGNLEAMAEIKKRRKEWEKELLKNPDIKQEQQC